MFEKDGIDISGAIDVNLNGLSLNELSVSGTLTVAVNKDGLSFEKTVDLLYKDGNMYINLDGVKLCAGVEDAVAMISEYISLPEIPQVAIDVGNLFECLLSDEFALNFSSFAKRKRF